MHGGLIVRRWGAGERLRVLHVMQRVDLVPLAELFRAKVLTMLKKEGLVDDVFIDKLMKWRHTSGFSVDN